MLTLPDKIQLVVIWSLDATAILINILLIAAIVLRTPKPLRTYSVFLLNNALVDLATAVTSALGSVRVAQEHEEVMMIFVFLGPCTLIGDHFCRFCEALHLHLVQHSTVVLLLSFCYRLYVLSDMSARPPPSRARVWQVCALSLLLIVPSIFTHYLEQDSACNDVRSFLHLQHYTISCFNMLHTRAIILISIVAALSPLVMLSIFVVRRKLIARISQSKTIDKRQHEFIARALTYQMLLPCGAAIATTIWTCDLTQIWTSELIERSIMLMFSMFSLASPLINFTMLPPYRAMLPKFARPQVKPAESGSAVPPDFTSMVA